MIVKGQIFLEDTGETAIGTIVLQKGTNNGVNADVNGRFSIDVPLGSILVFKMLGYKDLEVLITQNHSNIVVELEVDSILMDPIEITNKPKKAGWLVGALVAASALFLITRKKDSDKPKEVEI